MYDYQIFTLQQPKKHLLEQQIYIIGVLIYYIVSIRDFYFKTIQQTPSPKEKD